MLIRRIEHPCRYDHTETLVIQSSSAHPCRTHAATGIPFDNGILREELSGELLAACKGEWKNNLSKSRSEMITVVQE
jgi:hypothetical protein